MYKTFRSIATHIRENIADITWIDRDKGQLTKPEKFNSIICPGVLIGLGKINWKGQSRGDQLGEGSVTVKLIFTLPPATHQGADWADYEQYENLTGQLYDSMSAHASVGDRTSSTDYFTEVFYVAEQTFDVKVYHTKPIRTINKPNPEITGTLTTTIEV